MSRIILANKLKERFFIIEYFFGQNMLIGTLRMFGAPLMLGLGIWFLFSEAEFSLYFAAILIVYALYFGLRPWLFVYFKRSAFETSLFEIEINNDGIIISEKDDESAFDFTDFKSIEKRKEYFVLKFKTKKELYLPVKQLNESELSVLTKRML